MLKRVWHDGRSGSPLHTFAHICTRFSKSNDPQAGQSQDLYPCMRVWSEPGRLRRNGRSPESASSEPENLAGVEGVEPANAGIKIRCLNQLGDTPTRDSCCCQQPTDQSFISKTVSKTVLFIPTCKPCQAFYQLANGWISRLLHLWTRQPPGALAKSASCGSCANTALPEPVILP